MDFQAQDPSNVKSLLAFLRTSQETRSDAATAAPATVTASPVEAPQPQSSPAVAPPIAPPAKTLTELLAALQKRPQASSTPPHTAQPQASDTQNGTPSPQDGASIASALLQQHLEPEEVPQSAYEPFMAFGPIASQNAPPRRPITDPAPSPPVMKPAQSYRQHPDMPKAVLPSRPTPTPTPSAPPPRSTPVTSTSSLVDRARAAAAQTPLASALKKRALEEDAAKPRGPPKGKARASREEMRNWSFAKALPVLSGLLEDEEFIKQVKAMKAEQDALERKLWAQQEKLQSAHIEKGNNERTLASLARRPWTDAQEKAHKAMLESKVAPFHKLQVVPALDALAARHHTKLEALGVPGLGPPLAGSGGWGAVGTDATAGNDKETAARVKKLMTVLESVVAEHE